MITFNPTDTDQFKNAMHEAGITPPDFITANTGRPLRFHIDGDKKGSKNGWYIFHDDFPQSGAFGCYKRDIRRTFSTTIHKNHVADCIKQHDRLQIINRTVDREAEKQAAIAIWERASLATDGCSYLKAKQVKSHSLRYYQNALLVPVMDIDGNIHGVQRIFPDGTKRFITGTDKRGNFFQIGKPHGNTILMAEGYATAATLHEVTGHFVVVAFDAGNLKPVAEALRAKYPLYRLVICADDDRDQDCNPGLTAATEAAGAIDGVLAVPTFRDTATKPTDFNDLFCLEGAEAVRSQIDAVNGGKRE